MGITHCELGILYPFKSGCDYTSRFIKPAKLEGSADTSVVNVVRFTKLPPLFRRFLPPLQKFLFYLKGFPYYGFTTGVLREYYGTLEVP